MGRFERVQSRVATTNGRPQYRARELARDESRHFAPDVNEAWYEPQRLGFGGDPRVGTPLGSGVGYTSSPFSGYYDKTWGIAPSTDLPKYRVMYRTVPIIHAAIDKLVESATAKGFGLETPHDSPRGDEAKGLIEAWIQRHPEFAADVIPAVAKDMLTYGTAYLEPCYADTTKDQILPEDELSRLLAPDLDEIKQSGAFGAHVRYHPAFHDDAFDPGVTSMDPARLRATLYDRPFVAAANPTGSITLVRRGSRKKGGQDRPSPLLWLKNLDPLTMRVRRDAFGNEYGAIQFISTPPVAFDTSKVIIGRWNRTSVFYESGYGASLLQSLIRTQESIWQIENDVLLIGHALARPNFTFKRGSTPTPDMPAVKIPDAEWSSFKSAQASRQAGSDLYLPPWVEATPLPSPGATLQPIHLNLQYHHTQRTIGLRVPPNLLGVPDGTNRASAHVSQADYILTVQSLQAALARVMQRVFETILAPWREEFGDDYVVPTVQWTPIMERDEAIELDKILKAKGAGLMTMREARGFLAERGIFEIVADDPKALAELNAARSTSLEEDDARKDSEEENDVAEREPAATRVPGQPTTTRGEVKEQERTAAAKPKRTRKAKA